MSQPYRTILIEDEKLARNRLKKLLDQHREQIEIIREADNGDDGYRLINEHKPDLIFLDIQMPVLNGFEMLRKLTHQPRIIFTTAYEEYAIRAFEENSLDYLLKPIRAERLEVTIKKLTGFMHNRPDEHAHVLKIAELIEKMKPEKKLNAITVSVGDRILLIRLENIIFFQSEDKYTFIHDVNDKKYIIDHSLGSLEKKLAENFIRIHRSYIINYNYINEIRKGFNGKLLFEMADKNKTAVTTGSSYTSQVKEKLKF